MNRAEIHLFIIWSQALHAADAILSDINAVFETLQVVDVVWSPEMFSQNIARFYTTQLPPGSHKEQECGTGPFRVIVIRDPVPAAYERRLTSKGWASVNARVFDARARYRDWTGGGHKIHASVTGREAYRDLRLLFDVDANVYGQAGRGLPMPIRPFQDLIGAKGWESLPQLMRALTAVTPAVVLFGVDPINAGVESDAPTTMLVDDRWDAVMIANGCPRKTPLFGRLTYDLNVAGRQMWFDLRQVGEGYFDPRWERAMLDGRIEVNGVPMPSGEDQRHVWLYENLVRPSGRRINDKDYASSKHLLEPFFARTGYNRTTLRGPGVPVKGEIMPLKWKIGAVGRWLARAGRSVQRRMNERFGRVGYSPSQSVVALMQDRQR